MLEPVFNVNTFLKSLILDILTGNWDGPHYNKNNFYLYHNPRTDLFEYIPFDLDNTIGIDWFGVDWASRNIYDWAPQGEPRPLYQRLMAIPVFRERFTYYVQKIANEHMIPSQLFTRIEAIRDQIVDWVEIDPFYPLSYGFSSSDFNNSYTSSINYNHTPYGIIPYLTSRKQSALAQWETTNSSPIIQRVQHNFPGLDQDIIITAQIEDEESVIATLFYSTDGINSMSVPFLDNGLQGDAEANDGIYGAILPPVSSSTLLEYYIEVTDLSGKQSRSPSCDQHQISIAIESLNLVINEFMASNNSTLEDEWGEYDDWIEIYNADNQTIWLGDKFLSDDPEHRNKWAFPSKTISPGQYMIFWADDSPFQGDFHTNFKLKASGEHIGIYSSFETGLSIIDTLNYSEQSSDVSLGRLPNGSGPIQVLPAPSPGENNETANATHAPSFKISMELSPNPFTDQVQLNIQLEDPADVQLNIFDPLGQNLFQQSIDDYSEVIQIQWNGKNNQGQELSTGVYYVVLSKNGQQVLQEVLVKID